ncbi:MAG TPA: sigma-54 dependent transcriptional regulator [Candidatus Binatia bacterium]|nr:sigma-54 dependent transcriptional regulator [Candidatus Binatia bacterium]
MSTILVVDDERAIGIAIRRLLMAQGHEVDTALSVEEAQAALERRTYHLVVTDLSLRGGSGLDVLGAVKARSAETAVVVITAYGSERIAVEAMKLGAADYVPKPFDNDELELVVARALESVTLRRDLRLLQEQVSGTYAFENIIGKSAAMQRVFDVVRKVADTDLTVLIRGPSGTGKELVANAVHWRSPRRTKPFVKVNCAAFARDLVESELFGHEKGAFTGATSAREGKFEVADGGTLLLDEIGDMPLETQAKILRVLQEREFERVGGNRAVKVDVRVLAATNQDLDARVGDGRFREDLYYRLNVVTVSLPGLAERPEDLPLLIERFLGAAAERLRRPARTLAPAAYRALLGHTWPGNVRELEHAIEQAVALASGDEITCDDLPAAIQPAVGSASDREAATTFRDAKQRVVEEFERGFIGEALGRHQGNISKAAEEMGMYRQQLQQKLTEYGIDADAYRRR